jgi:hypothetical protein
MKYGAYLHAYACPLTLIVRNVNFNTNSVLIWDIDSATIVRRLTGHMSHVKDVVELKSRHPDPASAASSEAPSAAILVSQ